MVLLRKLVTTCKLITIQRILLSTSHFNFNIRSRHIMTAEGNRFSSQNKDKDHLEVTKNQVRSSGDYEAVVETISQISPTVKQLKLRVKGEDQTSQVEDENKSPSPSPSTSFSFLPGQWLDVFIPGVKKVGGFSITSSPLEFEESGMVDLAVKYSTWPPSHWVHTQCKEGSLLKVRSGGDFTLPSKPTGDLIFVAGGVGINPIASMITHLHDLNYSFSIKLHYTVKTLEELIFKSRFDALAETNKKFEVVYYVTAEEEGDVSLSSLSLSSGPGPGPERRRLTLGDLSKAVTKDTVTVFVCGPPPLIQLTTTIETKREGQVQDVEIKFEKWWM